MISTVPTLLQRQGVFTEAIAGRVPAIYDPATTGPVRAARPQSVPRQHDSRRSGWIRSRARCWSGIRCRPAPGPPTTTAACDNETVDQDQFSVRIDHRFAANRDQVFGRLTRFQEEFIPVTPLPDGSGVTTGTLGPQDTTSWSFASSYQRTFSNNAAERAAHRRHADGPSAERPRSWTAPASTSLGLPGIPSTAQFPNTLPTFLIGGYQQLGSPPNTASDFGTSVTEIADTLHVAEGTAHDQDGRGPAVGAAQRRAAAVADRVVHVQQPVHRSARHDGRTPARRSPAFCSARCSSSRSICSRSEIRNRAHFQEYFIQDDWRLSDRVTVNAGVRYTLNFPSTEENDQAAVFNLETQQLEYLGPRRPAARRPAAPQAQLRSTARHRRTRHRQDGGANRLRDGLDRDGGHHDAVHDAGLSVPADRVAADARQHHAGVHARRGTQRRADSADADCRPRTGRVLRRPRSRLRLRPAVEHVAAARARRRTSRSRSPTSGRRSPASAFPTRT